MKLLWPSTEQWKTLTFPFPIVVLASYYLMCYDIGMGMPEGAALLLMTLALGMVSWWLSIAVNNSMNQLLPGSQQLPLRVLCIFLSHLSIKTIFISMLFLVIDKVPSVTFRPGHSHFIAALAVAILNNIVFTSIWQVRYTFEHWKAALIEKELMEQEQVLREYRLLKEQLHPFFLFDSLQVLGLLIRQDVDRSVEYLYLLSKIYRAFLSENKKELCSLEQEIGHVALYAKLLETAHAVPVRLDISPSARMAGYWLPPFSIQRIIEDVKDLNYPDPVLPEIRIWAADNHVHVAHGLQGPRSSTPSANLRSIVGRYNYLKMGSFSIKKTADTLLYSLPLKIKQL